MSAQTDHPDDNRDTQRISRKDPIAARILRRWRRLTGGKAFRDTERKTIIACSGGADSVALAAVLSLVEPKPVIAHVLHDIRTDGTAEKDRDAVRVLADQLGCPFVERTVAVRDLEGNLEHNARTARYEALIEIAAQEHAQYIATGHHGDDQLETMLMHLIRGSGVRGLAGIQPSRQVGDITLIRPMLDVSREEIEALCKRVGVEYQHDHTNDDQQFLRNRIRHSLIPLFKEIEPVIAHRAVSSAEACNDANELIERFVVDQIMPAVKQSGTSWEWTRQHLREQPSSALAELVFIYAREVLDGLGMDTIKRSSIEDWVRTVKSEDTDPHIHRVGPMIVNIFAGRVVFTPASTESAGDSEVEDRSHHEH